jgi:hypothetical protein
MKLVLVQPGIYSLFSSIASTTPVVFRRGGIIVYYAKHKAGAKILCFAVFFHIPINSLHIIFEGGLLCSED